MLSVENLIAKKIEAKWPATSTHLMFADSINQDRDIVRLDRAITPINERARKNFCLSKKIPHAYAVHMLSLRTR
jgi:hypothetical protein